MIGQKTRLMGAEDGSGEIPEAGGKEGIWTEKLQNKNFEGDEWCYHYLERESETRLGLKLKTGEQCPVNGNERREATQWVCNCGDRRERACAQDKLTALSEAGGRILLKQINGIENWRE